MDSPQHIRGRATVRTVCFSKPIVVEGQDGSFSKQSQGESFLECICNNPHLLPSKRKSNQMIILCLPIGSIKRQFEEKTFSFDQEESALSLRKCKIRTWGKPFDAKGFNLS